jgi:hypothetical protein
VEFDCNLRFFDTWSLLKIFNSSRNISLSFCIEFGHVVILNEFLKICG